MNATCLYNQDEILQEHSYFLPTLQSSKHSTGYWKSHFDQFVSQQSKFEAPLSIHSLFFHDKSNTGTLCLCSNWGNDIDDPAVNFVGAVEEISNDNEKHVSNTILATDIVADYESQNCFDDACGDSNSSDTLQQHAVGKLSNIDHHTSPIQHEHLPLVTQCQTGIHNMNVVTSISVHNTQSNEDESLRSPEANAPLIQPHIAIERVAKPNLSPQQLQCGDDHLNSCDRYMKTLSSPISGSFQKDAPLAAEKRAGDILNTDPRQKEGDVPILSPQQLQCGHDHPNSCDRYMETLSSAISSSVQEDAPLVGEKRAGNILNTDPRQEGGMPNLTSSPCANLVDVPSIHSNAGTELMHLHNIEYGPCQNLITDDSSMNILSSCKDQDIPFTGINEFPDVDCNLEPSLSNVSKNCATSDTESSISNPSLSPRMNLRQLKVDVGPKHGFVCQICRKLCQTASILKHHIKHSHSPFDLTALPALFQEVKCSSCKVDFFMCLYCCKTYFSIKKIVGHTERHRTRSCFRCNVCSVKFFMSDRWHLLDHDIKPCCTVCQSNDKASSVQIDLQDLTVDTDDFEMPEVLPDDEELGELWVEDVTNWDPEVLLHRLLIDDDDEEMPNLPTQNYHKGTRSSPSKHSDPCRGSTAGSSSSTIDHETNISTLQTIPTQPKICVRAGMISINRDGDTTPGERLKCQYCGESFSKDSKFLAHIEIRHGYCIDHPNKPYQCHLCEEKFAHTPALQIHVQGHYMKIRRCDFCKKIFGHERNFTGHRCSKM